MHAALLFEPVASRELERKALGFTVELCSFAFPLGRLAIQLACNAQRGLRDLTFFAGGFQFCLRGRARLCGFEPGGDFLPGDANRGRHEDLAPGWLAAIGRWLEHEFLHSPIPSQIIRPSYLMHPARVGPRRRGNVLCWIASSMCECGGRHEFRAGGCYKLPPN